MFVTLEKLIADFANLAIFLTPGNRSVNCCESTEENTWLNVA